MFTQFRRTTPTLPVAEAPDPGEPIQVATKHIPFVEKQWLALTAVQTALEDKKTYVGAAEALGVRTATTDALAKSVKTETEAIDRASITLDRIKALLALGAEPTTPPRQWYCGWVEAPKKITIRGTPTYPNETWPTDNIGRTDIWGRCPGRVFHGAMPLDVLTTYAAIKSLADEIRVYSPAEDDFEQLVNPAPRDPVMIAMVSFLGERLYFEVARWDIDADLAAVFGSVARK